MLLTLWLSACDTPDVSPEDHADALIPPYADLQALLNDGGNESQSLDPVQFPRDAMLQPEARSEALQLRAILFAENTPTVSVSAQFARLAVLPDMELQQTSLPRSDWSFTQVMMSELQMQSDSDDGIDVHYQHLQRVALGLAGSELNRIWVGEDSLDVERINDCQRSYTMAHKLDQLTSLTLQWSIRNCPEVSSIRHSRQWSEHILSVRGFLNTASQGDAQAVVVKPLQGYAWMTQLWGAAPISASAVVLDQLELSIDELGLINITRSKRRSGKGPMTISATRKSKNNPPQGSAAASSIAILWKDVSWEKLNESGLSHPSLIHLSSDDGQLDLQIQPLQPAKADQANSAGELVTSVVVSGSHQGYGFMRFIPLQNHQ